MKRYMLYLRTQSKSGKVQYWTFLEATWYIYRLYISTKEEVSEIYLIMLSDTNYIDYHSQDRIEIWNYFTGEFT